MNNLIIAYIGPGMGLATIVIVLIITFLVIFSIGFIVWYKLKEFFKKK